MEQFLNPIEGRDRYSLNIDHTATTSDMEQALAWEGIAAIEMPLSAADFERFSEGYAVCIEECPELLVETAHRVDNRFGNEVGHVSKERKINERTGLQISDAKNYFHFNELARTRWQEQFAKGPKVLRDFLANGYEIQDALVSVAKQSIGQLDATHPNISQLYFSDAAGQPTSHSFLRLLRYDGYLVSDNLGEVAKPHYDIGGVTLQAYASAEGFWGAAGGVHGERTHYDTKEHEAYLFLGKGHEKMYGSFDTLKPLWHGVDRIIPAKAAYIPERTAVILFVNAPAIDYHVRATDTVPYILGEQALATIDY